LKGLQESCKIEWAKKFGKFYSELNDYKNSTDVCSPEKLAEIEQKYDELIELGKLELAQMKPKHFATNELKKMLKRLEDYKRNYLLFLRDYAAPFTNNQAERDLRSLKAKQKVSGCFRSYAGASTFVRLKSYVLTAKRTLRPLLDSIAALFPNSFHLLA
jgi:transposase